MNPYLWPRSYRVGLLDFPARGKVGVSNELNRMVDRANSKLGSFAQLEHDYIGAHYDRHAKIDVTLEELAIRSFTTRIVYPFVNLGVRCNSHFQTKILHYV